MKRGAEMKRMTRRLSVLSMLVLSTCNGGSGVEGTEGASDGTSSAASTTEPSTGGSTIGVDASTGADGTTGEPEPEILSVDFVEIPWSAEEPFEITEMRFLPGSNELLLLSKPGVVYHYELVGDMMVEIGSFALADTFPNNDCGLLSVAFDPDFDDNNLFYVGACVNHDFSAVYRLQWDPDDYDAVIASRVLIITEGDTNAEWPWHNVGSIGFFPDESMWIGFGDKTVDANGQDLGTNLATMLRVLPDRDPSGPGGYEPAPGNPFPESPDIWAYGLRVPFRTTMDNLERLIVADVGAVDWEEINLIDGPGLNFGWDRAEGPCEDDCEGLTDPVISWRHATNEYAAEDPMAIPTARWVVWVGPFYDPPPGMDRYSGLLTERMLFGDMCVGWVRTLGLDAEGQVVYDHHAGHLEHAVAWDIGPDGYVYGVASGGCVNLEFGDAPATMFRVVQADAG